ncbi:MAG: LysR family transcriptional regulator, partial [Leucothrix sp.]
MDNRKLAIFHTVATLNSFSQAAEHMHIAQSAVSVAIKKLEDELGLLLFDRNERKIRLTVEGQRLLSHASIIQRQFAEAQQDMAALHNLTAGRVSFSTTAMMGSHYFPARISQFKLKHPEIDFRVINEGTEGVLELLDSGEVDMGVVNSLNIDASLDAIPLCSEPIVVCVAAHHPLATLTVITEAEYCQQRLVLYRQNYYLRQLTMALHAKHQCTPQITMETDLLGMIIQLVRAGEGVTLGLQITADSEAG